MHHPLSSQILFLKCPWGHDTCIPQIVKTFTSLLMISCGTVVFIIDLPLVNTLHEVESLWRIRSVSLFENTVSMDLRRYWSSRESCCWWRLLSIFIKKSQKVYQVRGSLTIVVIPHIIIHSSCCIYCLFHWLYMGWNWLIRSNEIWDWCETS